MIKFESEKHFENFILECFRDDGICLIDNKEYEDCISQFDTKSYGIPDIIFYSFEQDVDGKGNISDFKKIHVVELKNEQIKLSHIAQIARYQTYFKKAYDGFDVEMLFSLVVPEGVVNNDDCCWMINALDGIDVYEYKLDPRAGIKFHESKGWHKTKASYFEALNLLGLDEEDREQF